MIPGHEGQANLDATKGRSGRAIREFVYVLTTPQRFGALSWFDVIRDPKAWLYLTVLKVLWLMGAPDIIWGVFLLPAVWRFGVRAWFFLPMVWREGARHVVVLYTANGYWHSSEYIHGRGEVNQVLVDQHGPISAATTVGLVQRLMHVDWGVADTPENPRDVIRMVRTYRRRPAWYQPLMFYARTNVGFACHVLGIRSPMIRSPSDLMDYLEKEALPEEHQPRHLEPATG